MEFQGDMLVVACPKFDHHLFLYDDHRNPRAAQRSVFSGITDLRHNLQPGSTDSFPSDVLSFVKSDIHLSRKYFIDFGSIEKYEALLMLPLPEEIFALRRGTIQSFTDNAESGNVKSSIVNVNASGAALVTRLKYFASAKNPPPFVTRSYYAEHCYDPDICEVNAALDAARAAFGKEFDLKIKGLTSKAVPLDDRTSLPDEVYPEDERALSEIIVCLPPKEGSRPLASVEPATCPNFGVR
jgi:hypothetical protein